MTVAIKLSPHTHYFDFVEERIKRIAVLLKERYTGFLGAIGELPQDFDLATVDEIAEFLRAHENKEILASLEQVVGYGVLSARQGEKVLESTPKEKDLVEVLKEDNFVKRESLKFAKAYTLNEIQTKDAQTIGNFKARLFQTLERGEHPSKAARELAQDLDDDFYGWMRIARTETARALNAGLFEETKRLGNDYVFVPHSPTTCEKCAALVDERVFKLSDIEGKTNYKRKQADWIPALPLHPNCTHFPIPASSWTIAKAKEEGEGGVPQEGVKIEYIPPHKRGKT